MALEPMVGLSWDIFDGHDKFMSKTLKSAFCGGENQADFSPLVWQLLFFLSFLPGEIRLGLSNKNMIEKKIWIVYGFLYIIFSPNSTF